MDVAVPLVGPAAQRHHGRRIAAGPARTARRSPPRSTRPLHLVHQRPRVRAERSASSGNEPRLPSGGRSATHRAQAVGRHEVRHHDMRERIGWRPAWRAARRSRARSSASALLSTDSGAALNPGRADTLSAAPSMDNPGADIACAARAAASLSGDGGGRRTGARPVAGTGRRAAAGLWEQLRGYDPPPRPANGIGLSPPAAPRRPQARGRPNGLYIVGEVGRGKSMLMDLFFAAADVRAQAAHPLPSLHAGRPRALPRLEARQSGRSTTRSRRWPTRSPPRRRCCASTSSRSTTSPTR